jgi:hypothetical protein
MKAQYCRKKLVSYNFVGAFISGPDSRSLKNQRQSGPVPIPINFTENEIGAVLTTLKKKKLIVRTVLPTFEFLTRAGQPVTFDLIPKNTFCNTESFGRLALIPGVGTEGRLDHSLFESPDRIP